MSSCLLKERDSNKKLKETNSHHKRNFLRQTRIPVRGKTDSGWIHNTPEPDQPLQNEGNFRPLLQYAAESRDKDLSEHLVTFQKNTLYTSPQIQNEIIDICGKII
ncbi:unnamed protein product [Euphydryas editha]|uniref:Uncharacterized protein n=1 Tax=Euphydryas editha TaxID=104508 RepID=A0AAU9U9N8_EUPED|nr:unnamed protein product [Euphydryas editha]